MEAIGIQRLLLAAGLAFGLPAAGWSEPFYLPNEHPVIRLFGLPPAESGRVATGTTARATFDWANNSFDDWARGETLTLDGETYVA